MLFDCPLDGSGGIFRCDCPLGPCLFGLLTPPKLRSGFVSQDPAELEMALFDYMDKAVSAYGKP